MALEATNLTPRVGAQIRADREGLIRGEYSQEIRTILEQRGVVVFRGLHLTDEEHWALSETLGEIIPQGEKGIYKISLDMKKNATADLLYGAFCWHIDGTTDDIPTRASMLSPRKLSETGGQTEFANTYASYDDLPDSDKAMIDKLRVVHMQESIQRQVFPYPTEEQVNRWRNMPTKTHPLVWTHESGRKSLVLGLTATSIEGMDPVEGKALLRRLQEWASQPQYVYRHEWEMGDSLIWDNTGVMHRVSYYPPDCGRMLHRTTLVGEEALV
jgi:alpha-ketoglutarate-dependent taurine dioxygenase